MGQGLIRNMKKWETKLQIATKKSELENEKMLIRQETADKENMQSACWRIHEHICLCHCAGVKIKWPETVSSWQKDCTMFSDKPNFQWNSYELHLSLLLHLRKKCWHKECVRKMTRQQITWTTSQFMIQNMTKTGMQFQQIPKQQYTRMRDWLQKSLTDKSC